MAAQAAKAAKMAARKLRQAKRKPPSVSPQSPFAACLSFHISCTHQFPLSGGLLHYDRRLPLVHLPWWVARTSLGAVRLAETLYAVFLPSAVRLPARCA
jgi:hypothetical protein